MSLKSIYRTHTLNELNASNVEEKVVLSGWVMRKRDHGGVVFVDLRDHYGVTQVVFNDSEKAEIQNIRIESVITVNGKVVKRDAELINPKIPTGEIEVVCEELTLQSAASVLPFLIAEEDNAPESIRLRSRFLELRKENLHNNIVLRSKVISKMRELMTDVGFLEIQTPILTSSSPEGARDFIVPSRLHPGRFFALPQAPQQFKQLLMTSGFDRYFQIAPCFRDEDPRADRSPGEFYQLDMELSFVEENDVLEVNENVISKLFKEFSDLEGADAPFKRIAYKEALELYGSDKPDLRNSLTIKDISHLFKESEFRVFKDVLSQDGGAIKTIAVKTDDIPSRKYFDDAIKEFTKQSGRGLAYLIYSEDSWKGSISKFFSESEFEALKKDLNLTEQHILFFVAGPRKETYAHLARLRDKLGADFNKVDQNKWEFCWIVDYPLYERNDEGVVEFSHNPFSMPKGGVDALTTKDPEDVMANQYDLVLNGCELASGAIRNHSPEIMYKAFEIAGYSKETVDKEFSGMINAFKFGAPPHGGIAHGIERIIMLLAGEEAIREVIPFPLSQTAEDLMMRAPSEVSEKQLSEVHIAVKLPEEKEEKQ